MCVKINVHRIIGQLKRKYPGKKIIQDKNEKVSGIICEIDPAASHSKKSTALAVVDKTALHYHQKATEIYKVIKGQLTLFMKSPRAEPVVSFGYNGFSARGGSAFGMTSAEKTEKVLAFIHG